MQNGGPNAFMMMRNTMMAMDSMNYKIAEMTREAAETTDPDLKAAFTAVAAEYQTRQNTMRAQAQAHMFATLAEPTGTQGPQGPTGTQG
jgi:hypothetical protein